MNQLSKEKQEVLNCTLREAVLKESDTNTLKELISEGADVNGADGRGRTPLVWAIFTSSLANVKFLLEHGADPNKLDKEKNSILKFAVCHKGGNIEITKALLKHGAKIDRQDITGMTPLMWTVLNKNLPLMKLLLENGADPNIANTDEHTPLMWASGNGTADIVKLLIKYGADVNAQSGDMKIPPLSFAITCNNTDIVKALLEAGADPNIRNEYGDTPLMDAVGHNRLETTKLLLKHGADPNARNMFGDTPLSESQGEVRELLESAQGNNGPEL